MEVTIETSKGTFTLSIHEALELRDELTKALVNEESI